AGIADQSRPVRQSVCARHAARTKMSPQVRPWFIVRGELCGDCGNVEQYRLDALMNGQLTQALWIHSGRTQQLSGDANLVKGVAVLPQAESHADFLIADGRLVRRQRRVEVALVVACAALDGHFEEPFRQSLASAACPCQPDRQTGNVCFVPQLLSQCRRRWLFLQVHDGERNTPGWRESR